MYETALEEHARHRKDKANDSQTKTFQGRQNHLRQVPRWNQEERVAEGAFDALIPPLKRAISDAGYLTPTPIQEQAIPHLLKGKDMLGCAQTGTGKTAAFMLPILQYLVQHPKKPSPGKPRVLVLTPTRELAAQIGDSISTYGRYSRVSHVVIYGGVGQNPQVAKLKQGRDVVVATPGRLLDLMRQGHISLNTIEVFVLDEADRMLDMGFLPDIRRIIEKLPKKRQTLFFSATMAPPVVALAQTLVHNAVRISINPEQPTVEKISQKILFVDKKNKNPLLISLLGNPLMDRVIVFTRMKHVANRVAEKLNKAGISATAIHGNKSQRARTQALSGFKRGKTRVLVATDVAARGIDVENISHVINYDLPEEPEMYVHRIGRTGRAGLEGSAISFCSVEERGMLDSIEVLIGKKVPTEIEHRFHSEAARIAINSRTPSGSGLRRQWRPRRNRSANRHR
ncbi:MAG: ATP-dependent helicase [Deltaproteobacteria bacterium]|nr:MAG: ATP-dependent helicase [Deltaproteobacteria bacterium]